MNTVVQKILSSFVFICLKILSGIFIILSMAAHASPAAQENNIYDQSFRVFLKDVQESSIRNKDWQKLDWDKYLNTQLDKIPLHTKEDFYQAVQEALHDLGDHHSFLLNSSLNEVKEKKIIQDPISITVNEGIGIINFPYFTYKKPPTEEFIEQFHQELEQIKPMVSRGWVINLQNNFGGNMYPMLACLSDFWINRELGGFYVYSENHEPLIQKLSFNGQSFLYDNEEALSYKHRYSIGTIVLPTIVLIGHNTSSSAEFLALALKRQPNIILAGQSTYGLATGNALMSLANDLGQYMLTVAHDLDDNNLPLLSEKIEPQIVIDREDEQIKEAINLLEAAEEQYKLSSRSL
ncbi:MAG: S41 family peptidase [Gammaproteobacteria bacterium]